MEFLCADEHPSWWHELFVDSAIHPIIHHMGYKTPEHAPVCYLPMESALSFVARVRAVSLSANGILASLLAFMLTLR